MEIVPKNSYRILNLFRKNLFLKLSVRELMKKIGSRSYQRVHEAVASLVKENILLKEKVGSSSLISLKLSEDAIQILSFLDYQSAKEMVNYQKISQIREISDFLVLVTGSYANNTFTKKSDMDLVVIVPDGEKVVPLQRLVENITMLYIPKIHLYVLRKRDFLEMLGEKSENYGKTIVKNQILIRNPCIYYELIRDAAEKGYKG